MFLNKKKKPDNKGVALASVLLITAFVMVITSSVLSMAYNTYRMKLINVSSKDNLYACEAVLEQVRVGFRNQFSEITEELDEITSETLVTAFQKFYSEYKIEDGSILVDMNNSVSGSNAYGIYYYDVVEVAKLLTSITGTGGASIMVDADGAVQKLEYVDNIPVFTSSVDITVNDSAYDNIKLTLQANATGKNNFELTDTSVTFHDLTVIYSENGYESEVTTDITIEFPEVETVTSGTSGSGSAGWVTLDSDMVKTYGDWLTAIASGEAEDFGIDSVSLKEYDNYVYISTVDYPANSVKSIVFEMDRYYVVDYSSTSDPYYVHAPIVPGVTAQDGIGTGKHYGPTDDYENIYIYVGEENGEEVWVNYTDVFDTTTFFIKDISDTSSAAYKYYSYYADDLENAYDSTSTEFNAKIKYKVMMLDEHGFESSRGWICIYGSVVGSYTLKSAISPYLDAGSIQMYVDIEELTTPEYYFYDGVSESTYGTADANTPGFLLIDFHDSNYSVGDILHIKLYYIDIEYSKFNGAYNYWYYTINQLSYDQYPSSYRGSYNTQLYPASDGTSVSEYCTYIYDSTTKTIDISIPITWDMYPFLSVEYIGGLNNNVTAEVYWEGASTGSTTSTSISSDAAIYYEDWRKE